MAGEEEAEVMGGAGVTGEAGVVVVMEAAAAAVTVTAAMVVVGGGVMTGGEGEENGADPLAVGPG